MVEMLGVGLKAIMDTLSKQERLLQELVELEADKVELMQLDQWVLEDEEDKEEEEMEEGEEVEVEQELPELAKEKKENGDESEEEEEQNRSGIEDCHPSCTQFFFLFVYKFFLDVIKWSEVWACPGIRGESCEPAQTHV